MWTKNGGGAAWAVTNMETPVDNQDDAAGDDPGHDPGHEHRYPTPRLRALRALVGVVAVAVLIDLSLQAPPAGVAGLAAAAVLVATLLTVVPGRSRWSRACLGAAVLPAVFLPLRSTGWLAFVDVVAIAGLLALGAAMGPDEDPFDTELDQLARWSARIGPASTTAPATFVATTRLALPTRSPARRALAVSFARGLSLGLPVALVIGLLLASGDAVFASFFSWSVDTGQVFAHGTVLLLGLWAASTYLGLAIRTPPPAAPTNPRTFGPIEGTLVLAAMVVVYSLYAVARLVAVVRGDAYVQETTGLTYAEYARSGFFQLLWAAGITLVVLLVVRSKVSTPTPAWRRTVAGLSLAAVGLTLVMVHGAITRLDLYESAFGATVLRWSSTVFAGWVGLAFVLTGLSIAGVGSSRRWLTGVLVVSALATLLAVNLVNPEAAVMEANAARAERTGRLDVDYAFGLSDDAVPALVDALAHIDDPDEQKRATKKLCRRIRSSSDWNLAARRADDALVRLCTPRS